MKGRLLLLASPVILVLVGCTGVTQPLGDPPSRGPEVTRVTVPSAAASQEPQAIAGPASTQTQGVPANPETTAGCDASALPPLNVKYAVPARGIPTYPAILNSGGSTTPAEGVRARAFDLALPKAIPGDRTLRLMLLDDTSTDAVKQVRTYYATRDVGQKDTIWDFFDSGGIVVRQGVTRGITAATVISQIGDLATPVQIGPYDAAVTWGDPLTEGGVRPVGLYWSDGTYDWTVLAAVKTPDAAVDVGRSIYC